VVAPLLSGLLTLADAATPAAPAAHPGPQGIGGLLNGFLFPMALIFAVFYFMLIRPQQKKQKEQADWLKSLKKGDEVTTTGGIVGRITGFHEPTQTVVLEVQEKVRIKVLRSHIASKAPTPGVANASAAAPAPADTQPSK